MSEAVVDVWVPIRTPSTQSLNTPVLRVRLPTTSCQTPSLYVLLVVIVVERIPNMILPAPIEIPKSSTTFGASESTRPQPIHQPDDVDPQE